jgi:hypothetical protein
LCKNGQEVCKIGSTGSSSPSIATNPIFGTECVYGAMEWLPGHSVGKTSELMGYLGKSQVRFTAEAMPVGSRMLTWAFVASNGTFFVWATQSLPQAILVLLEGMPWLTAHTLRSSLSSNGSSAFPTVRRQVTVEQKHVYHRPI